MNRCRQMPSRCSSTSPTGHRKRSRRLCRSFTQCRRNSSEKFRRSHSSPDAPAAMKVTDMMKSRSVLQAFTLLILFGTSSVWAHADDFYRGKQIRLVIGNSVGAEYDLGGRL